MKKKSILTCFIFLLSAVLVLDCSAYDGVSWYTVRSKNRSQPRLDARLSVIERYNAAWIDTAHGDDYEEKVLYLTFDFGYENGNTERIVNTLRDKGVKASFFLLSAPIEKNTELVCRLFAEGHAVCNHTQHHRDMSKCCDKVEFTWELSGLEELCKLKTGYDMDKFYRPPEGKFTEENLRFATELGYKTVFWSFAYADWDNNAQPDPQKAKKLILENTHNGAVILLHPTSATNAEILGELIDEWRGMGYDFRTVKSLP